MDTTSPHQIQSSRILLPWVADYSYPDVALDLSKNELRPDPRPQGTMEVQITMSFGPDTGPRKLLPFLVTSALRNAATHIAIDPGNPLHSAISALEPDLKRFVLLDVPHPLAMPEFQALIQPVAAEFEVEFHYGSGFGAHSDVFDALPEDLRKGCLTLHDNLYRFFLGIKHRLQVDIPLEATMEALDSVLRVTTSQRTQRSLGLLQGILSGYRAHEVESLQFKPPAAPDQVRMLRDAIQDWRLLHDDTYMQFSAWRHSLGVPRQARRALLEIGRSGRKLLRSRLFGPLFDLAAQVIKAPISLPSRKALSALVPTEYLPPIVPSEPLPSLDEWLNIQFEREGRAQQIPASAVQQLMVKATAKEQAQTRRLTLRSTRTRRKRRAG